MLTKEMDNGMKVLSIVVPVYNVESYLDKCIQSLLKFDQRKVNIILVDDGSTDRSGEYCDKYRRDNIIVVHKQNGGLSDARNTGLDFVDTKYVWFVDSDDYINDICDDLLNVLDRNDADIFVMNYSKICGNERVPFIHSFIPNMFLSGSEYLKEAIRRKEYVIPVWSNVYKTKLFLNRKFRKGIYHEDEQITPYLFLDSECVLITDIVAYNYVYRENSIANSKKYEKNLCDMFSVFTENYNYFEENIKDIELKELLKNDMAEKIVYTLSKYRVTKKSVEKYVSFDFIRKCSSGKLNYIRYLVFRYFRCIYSLLFNINEWRKSI